METVKNAKGWVFQSKPVNRNDLMDLPFTISGIKLRWLAARKNENRHMNGHWVQLRKGDIPKELLPRLQEVYPGMFREGDLVRNGELVLGYSTIEHAKELRAELDRTAHEQYEKVFRRPAEPTANDALSIDRKETGVGQVGGEEFFNK